MTRREVPAGHTGVVKSLAVGFAFPYFKEDDFTTVVFAGYIASQA